MARLHDTQHNDNQNKGLIYDSHYADCHHLAMLMDVVMQNAIHLAECQQDECHYTE